MLSTEGCLFNITSPIVTLTLLRLWYTALGYAMVLVIGTIVSFLTRPQDPKKLDPRLVCDLGKKFSAILPRKAQQFLHFQIGDNFVGCSR